MVEQSLKLAIVTTHPIQYNAPLFKMLSECQTIMVKVFYTWSQARRKVYDPGFNKVREWDIPLLEGYLYTFVENTAKKPGSHHFWGIQNPRLIEEIEHWQPTAILVFGWSFYSHVKCLIHFKNKLPVFFRGDSTLLDKNHPLKAVIRSKVLKWIYRHIDIAFYVGENNRKYFRKHGVSQSRLVYAPHAIDNKRFMSITEQEQTELRKWKQSLGIQERDWVVLYVGKLEEKKNPKFLIRLSERLPAPNFKFLFVGNGQLEAELKDAAKDNRILFLDFQNQSKMPLVYRLGNVLILPSKGPEETWGLAANEAMCCGLPVVVSDKVGCAPDLVQGKETGLVFSSDEIDPVVLYVKHLHDNKQKYLQVKKAAVQHIQEFSYEKVACAFSEVLKKINRKKCASLL